MSDEDLPEIPEQIREVMTDEEIENMRNFDGWATGTVAAYDGNEVVATYQNAWIELFNDEGRAGRFGGVRCMVVDDNDEYREWYAIGRENAFDRSDGGYYVVEYDEPSDPFVGKPTPRSL